jgi:hypothetical protein
MPIIVHQLQAKLSLGRGFTLILRIFTDSIRVNPQNQRKSAAHCKCP